MTVQYLVHSILGNIFTNLANFLRYQNSILLKSIGFSRGNTTSCPRMQSTILRWVSCSLYSVFMPKSPHSLSHSILQLSSCISTILKPLHSSLPQARWLSQVHWWVWVWVLYSMCLGLGWPEFWKGGWHVLGWGHAVLHHHHYLFCMSLLNNNHFLAEWGYMLT